MDTPTDLDALLARVDALHAEIDALRPLSDEQTGRAMQRLRLEWTYHSNAIEGNSLTYGETRALLMHGVTAHGKPLKDHLDIRRHREAIGYLEAFVRSDEPLTLAALREMHRLLMGETYEVTVERPDGTRATRTERGGAFKEHPNNVVTETGETHYYASPQETAALMADLIDGLRRPDDAHPVVRAALFHHRFVEVHPFPDGNGRTARVLMNLLLMRAGYVPAVIRQDQRPAYYGALAAADGGDRQPAVAFVAFVAKELAETMGLYLRALRGEPDPDAFDRRIALVKREAESIPSAEITRPRRASLARDFVRPLLDAVGERSKKLAEFFNDHHESLVVEGADGVQEEGARARDLLSNGDWVRFEWVFRLEDLALDPARSMSVVVSGSVGVSGFSLRTRPGPKADREFKGSRLPGSADVEPAALAVGADALGVLEQFVRLARDENG